MIPISTADSRLGEKQELKHKTVFAVFLAIWNLAKKHLAVGWWPGESICLYRVVQIEK